MCLTAGACVFDSVSVPACVFDSLACAGVYICVFRTVCLCYSVWYVLTV